MSRRSYHHGWNILASCFVIQALAVGVAVYGFGTLMVPLAEEFGLSRMQMQLCYSLMMLLSGLLSPLGVLAMERISIRWLIAIGGLLFGAGYGVIAASVNYAMVLGAYVGLLSFAEIMLGNMATGALIAHWFSRRRGFALGISAVGFSFGGLVFPPLAAILIVHYGWRTAFAVLGILAAASILALAVFVIRDKPEDGEARDEPQVSGAGLTAEAHAYRESRVWSYSELLRSRTLWIFTIVLGGAQCAHAGVFLNLVPFATDHGVALPQAAVLVSIISVAGVFAKVAFGVVADRVDYRWVLLGVLIVNIIGTALLIASDKDYAVMIAAALTLGLGLGGMFPLWGVMVAREFGAVSFGRVIGMMRVVMVPASMSGPVFAGWMFDQLGNYEAAFYYLIALQVVLGLLLLVTSTSRAQPQAPATV